MLELVLGSPAVFAPLPHPGDPGQAAAPEGQALGGAAAAVPPEGPDGVVLLPTTGESDRPCLPASATASNVHMLLSELSDCSVRFCCVAWWQSILVHNSELAGTHISLSGLPSNVSGQPLACSSAYIRWFGAGACAAQSRPPDYAGKQQQQQPPVTPYCASCKQQQQANITLPAAAGAQWLNCRAARSR